MSESDLGRIVPLWCNRRHWPTEHVTGGLPLISFRLWYIAAGRIDVDTGTSRQRFTAGQWASAPRSFQQQRMHSGTELLSLGMEWHLEDGTSPLRRIPDGVLRLGRHDRRMQRLLIALGRLFASRDGKPVPVEGDDALSRLALARAGLWRIAGLLMELYPQPAEDGAGDKPIDTRVAQALRTLRLRARTRFPEGRLESITGLGRRRLEQLFMARIGATPRAYHARLRMEEARALVAQGRMQFKEIAATLEFASQSAFTQAFVHSYGMSPRAYQAREHA